MIDCYGLKIDVIKRIQQVFARFPEIRSAVLYGSRAMGNFKHGSDIDLTLKTTTAHSSRLLMRVMVALDDLDLPYSFDLSIFKDIDNDNLRDHIQRVGVEFYRADHPIQKIDN